MPYTLQEYRNKKHHEMNKWDRLLNQSKISPNDYVRHLNEFEAEHKEEEERLKEDTRIRAYSESARRIPTGLTLDGEDRTL